MPVRKGWLPREGFTADVVQGIVQKTILNPALTLPLLLLARYTDRGRGIALDHQLALSRLKLLLYLGAARWANSVLNRGALDNWQGAKFDWDKEIIVVTGGSDGFGKILVQLFAERNQNTKIIILDVQKPRYALPGPNVHFLQVDLSQPEDIAATCAELKSKHGNPSVVLLNAGIAIPYTIMNMPDSTLEKVFAVNTLAHYRLAREFLPHIVSQNHGMFVTTASLAGYVTPAGLVEYSASKAAAVSFHEGLSTELVHRYNAPKVRTICVCPNFAATKLADGFVNKNKFLSPTLQPETVAEAVFEKVISGSSGFVVLPKTHAWFAQTVRSWPWWLQKGISDGLKDHLIRFADRKEIKELTEVEE